MKALLCLFSRQGSVDSSDPSSPTGSQVAQPRWQSGFLPSLVSFLVLCTEPSGFSSLTVTPFLWVCDFTPGFAFNPKALYILPTNQFWLACDLGLRSGSKMEEPSILSSLSWSCDGAFEFEILKVSHFICFLVFQEWKDSSQDWHT